MSLAITRVSGWGKWEENLERMGVLRAEIEAHHKGKCSRKAKKLGHWGYGIWGVGGSGGVKSDTHVHDIRGDR